MRITGKALTDKQGKNHWQILWHLDEWRRPPEPQKSFARDDDAGIDLETLRNEIRDAHVGPILHDKQPAEDDLFAATVGNSRGMTQLRHAVVPAAFYFPAVISKTTTIIFAPLALVP
ncbi:MAG TPA: hypothetical protein VHU23_02250 [Rhizomicrobium sp.]|nr:hypothetical protein [Rhizomicrobium sp.]